MPAIQPARLKIQSIELVQSIDDIDRFVTGLHNLLSYYADRVRRQGQSGPPPPVVRSYLVPPVVLHAIEREVQRHYAESGGSLLELVDRLWQEAWLETRLLAIFLIGSGKELVPEEIVERLIQWGGSCTEYRLADALIEHGMNALRHGDYKEYESIMEKWMSGDSKLKRQIGLRAIIFLLQDPDYKNLPLIYRLLGSAIEGYSGRKSDLIVHSLELLAERSPQETVFFIKRQMSRPQSSEFAWLFRKSVDAFPPEQRDLVKDVLRSSHD